MPLSAHCSLLLAVTALCCFATMFALPEGGSFYHHCRCLITTDSRINSQLFQRIEIVPAGAHCRNAEVIITLKNRKTVCVEPEAEWIQKLISKAITSRRGVKK